MGDAILILCLISHISYLISHISYLISHISPLDSFRQMIIQIIPPKLFLERRDVCFIVDDQVFDTCHLGKIFENFSWNGLGEGSVVCSSCKNPGTGSDFEIWFRHPKRTGNGQPGHRCIQGNYPTSLTINRKRFPMSISEAFSAWPGFTVNLDRTGSAFPPIPSL